MSSGGGVSLEEAIRSKYCCQEDEEDPEEDSALPATRLVKEAAVYLRPGVHPVEQLTNIVLEGYGVSHVTSGAGLGDLCPQLQELHLARNSLSLWDEVSKVLTSLPQLTFLDLSHSPLSSPSLSPSPSPSHSLSPSPSPCPSFSTSPSPSLSSSSLCVLVLNCTSVPWSAVQTSLETCPRLQELHLTNNGYSTVTFDPSFAHTSLNTLHINNSISQWAELEKLSHAFPNLHTLVAISNPLQNISIVGSTFPSLQQLTLTSTQISDWTSVESLSTSET